MGHIVETPVPARVHPQTMTGVAFAMGAGLVMVLLSRWEPAFGVFSGIGLLLGFVMHRSRFCFTAAFRDLYLFNSGRNMKGVIVGMAVATVGFTRRCSGAGGLR